MGSSFRVANYNVGDSGSLAIKNRRQVMYFIHRSFSKGDRKYPLLLHYSKLSYWLNMIQMDWRCFLLT
ncbi:hypothetical protein DFP95_103194 [Cohnella lupini]|uniref:Uncharacterized protein n=1 Tax=Cohnella lupini TaxID=1294267 RepID=A0A3D9IQ92_9BACL|nr:hypothetical protein DFP95_103194 [Cohnella lupini]